MHEPVSEALKLLRRGETDAAMEHLRGLSPSPAVDAVRARALLSIGQRDEATALARACMAHGPAPWSALLTLATGAVREGRTVEADALIHRLERSFGDDPGQLLDVRLLRNEWLSQTGRLPEVVPRTERLLSEVAGHEPEATVARLAVATEYRRNGRHDDAQPLLDQAITTIRAHGWRSLEGRWQATRCTFPAPRDSLEEQVEWLREAIALMTEVGDHSRVTVLLNNLGSRLLALCRLDEADRVFAEGLERAEPRHAAFLLCGRFEALRRRGAIADSDRLIEAFLANPVGPAVALQHVSTANLSRNAQRGQWEAFGADLAATLSYLHSPPAQPLLRIAAATTEAVAPDAHLGEAAFLAALAWEGQRRIAADGDDDEARIRRLAERGAPAALPPYVLLEPIGRGGMGSVWRARHVPTGELRAIKTVPPASDAAAEAALAREIRALAMLGHPHVVPILDQGAATLPTEWGTRGAIPAGSTWIAMPLARRSLQALCGRIPWDSARTVLLAVLDALASAHAHGLLHLDVKPANILVDGDEPPYLATLADFGLARPERERDRTVSGTPDYMAPEQFRRVWREWGPWTDLYALGATAVALVQGRPPFAGASSAELAAAHLHAPVPPLAPTIDVPSGLDGWVARMMAKEPADRFPTAAAAAAGLAALGPAEARARSGSPTLLDAQCTFEWVDVDLEPAPSASASWAAAPDWPDVPEDWRTDALVSQTGTPALLAHRHVEVRGRDAERDLLWRALRRVHAGSGPEVVLLRGSRGMGTGRLLHWLSVRVATLGVGRVAHTRIDVPTALRALLRAEGAEGVELSRHLHATARRPPHIEVAPLLEALGDDAPDACASVLADLGRDAPLVLSIPGAQRPHAVLDVVERLLSREGRVLVAMGLRDDEAFAHPDVDARCTAAERLPGWTTHRVPSMGSVELRQVVRSLVPLEPPLLERLVARSRGNPGYAVSLVRAWRTSLTEGPDGLRVPEHVELRPPPGLERWLGLLSGVEPTLRAALQVLAVLSVAPADVWAEACLLASVPWEEGFAERARGAALVERHRDRLQLASPALADALLRDVEASGRASALHEAAAAALAGAATPDELADLGRHLFAAGRVEEAIDPLRAASLADPERAFTSGWLHALERALHAACAPDTDPRWLDALAALLDHHRARFQHHALRERLPRYARLAESEPRHRWRARMMQALLDEADPRPALHEVWRELPPDLGPVAGRLVQEAAWAALELGDVADAGAWLDRVDDPTDPLLLELRSEVERRMGRMDRSLDLAEGAAARVADGHPLAAAIWSHLGDLRRDHGLVDAAEAAYRRSLQLARERDDDRQAAVVELNLLLLRLRAGQPVPRSEILAVRRALRGGSRDAAVASALLGLLVLADDEIPAAVAAISLPADSPELRSIARLVAKVRAHPALAPLG